MLLEFFERENEALNVVAKLHSLKRPTRSFREIGTVAVCVWIL